MVRRYAHISILDSEKIIGRIAEKHKKQQEQILIKDIIDIYNGEYKDYSAYKKSQELIVRHARSFNNSDWDAYCEEDKVKYTICIEPIILSEDNFDYIKGKAKVQKKKKNNIDN